VRCRQGDDGADEIHAESIGLLPPIALMQANPSDKFQEG